MSVATAKEAVLSEDNIFYLNQDYYDAMQVLLDDGAIWEMPKVIRKAALLLIDEEIITYHGLSKI